MKNKQPKKKKLESLPKIHKRLFKIWSEKVRGRANNSCEYCNRKVGDLDEDGKPLIKVDAHHLQSRKIKGNPLKWDIRNAVCVCPKHHKFSCNESFHRSPVVSINWLMKNRPERFNYILEHYDDIVDLDNRLILEEIEKCLVKDKPINVDRLKEIEKANPRQPLIPKVIFSGNLFDEDKKSSSSSSD